LAPEGPAIKVAYYEPGLHSSCDDAADACRVHRLDRFKVSVGKWLIAEIALTNATAKLFFQLLFVEHYALDEAYRELTTLFDLKPAGQEAMWQELQQFHQRFAMYEYLPQWMPAWEGA
jgi:hypothetical protein